MSHSRRILLGIGFAVAAVLVIGLIARHLRSRSAVAVYKAELLAKGEKLTLAMLTSGRATNLNTSDSVITNAVTNFASLKCVPGLLTLRKYVARGEARVLWRQDSPGWSMARGAPTGATWDDLAADVVAAREPLDKIRQALKDPAPDAGPFSTNIFERRANFVAFRTAAQWFMGAALVALRQGRLEEGLQNLEALAALARMNRDEVTLVAQMIRVAIANLGLAATWEALAAPGWTGPQLERMQKAWENLDLVDALEKGMLGERGFGTEIFRLVHNNNGRSLSAIFGRQSSGTPRWRERFDAALRNDIYLPSYRLLCADDDELFYLKTMQGSLDGLRILKAHAPWNDARLHGDEALARINRLTNAFDGFHYYVSFVSIPNFSKAILTGVHGETERQMTLAVIALQRYELRYGKPATGLQALVPEFLTSAPNDPMTGQPLHYRPNADGSFVLYSTGEDGVDDGGDPTPTAGKGFGLWEGKDAVWPQPATAGATAK